MLHQRAVVEYFAGGHVNEEIAGATLGQMVHDWAFGIRGAHLADFALAGRDGECISAPFESRLDIIGLAFFQDIERDVHSSWLVGAVASNRRDVEALAKIVDGDEVGVPDEHHSSHVVDAEQSSRVVEGVTDRRAVGVRRLHSQHGVEIGALFGQRGFIVGGLELGRCQILAKDLHFQWNIRIQTSAVGVSGAQYEHEFVGHRMELATSECRATPLCFSVAAYKSIVLCFVLPDRARKNQCVCFVLVTVLFAGF